MCVCVQERAWERGFGDTFGHSCLLSLTLPQQWQGGVIRASITVIITILQLTADSIAICNGLLFDGEKGLHFHIVPGSEGRRSEPRETPGWSGGGGPPPAAPVHTQSHPAPGVSQGQGGAEGFHLS